MEPCPACHSTKDYRPTPNSFRGATWLVCQNCGYIQDEEGNVLDEGSIEMQRPRKEETE